MEDPLIGKILLDRYLVARVLGRGGMATVYRGEQQIGGITRPVAIKVLDRRSTADPNLVERFRREAETIVRLRHPNTVEIYDVGELTDGTMFFVMEHVEGEPLSTLIRRGPISSQRIDKIMLQICGSLHDAHTMGVVHRDLKPANVLLTNRGIQTDFVKVLDFGLAKTDWDGEKLTGDDRLLGTPAYMSPEQFLNTEVDQRSDIYALGVMTYQLVTGKLPFQAKSPWDWASKHTVEIPPPIGKFSDGTPLHPRKEKAIMRALAKKPEARHANVLEFLRDFTGIKDPSEALAQASAGTGQKPASSFHPPAMPGEGSSSATRTPRSQDKSYVMGTLDLPAEQKRKLAPQGLFTKQSNVEPAPEPTQIMSADLISEVSVASRGSINPTRPPPPTPVAALSIPTAPPPKKPAPPSPRGGGFFTPSVAPTQGFERNLASTPDLEAVGKDDAPLSLAGVSTGAPGIIESGFPRTGRRGGTEDVDWGDAERIPSIALATDGIGEPVHRSTRPVARPHLHQQVQQEDEPKPALKAVKFLAAALMLLAVGIVAYRFLGAVAEPPVEEQVESDPGAKEAAVDDSQRQKLDEMREKMRGGDLYATLDFLEAAAQDPTYPDVRLASLRVELSPKGSDEVAKLIRQGKCEDAQRLYVRLVGVDAGMGARGKFNARCIRP
jgi:serine/threonine protein kinase